MPGSRTICPRHRVTAALPDYPVKTGNAEFDYSAIIKLIAGEEG